MENVSSDTIPLEVSGGDPSIQAQIIRTTRELKAVEKEWEDFFVHRTRSHDVRQHPVWVRNEFEYPTTEISPFVVIIRDESIRCLAPFYLMQRKIPGQFLRFTLSGPTLRVIRPFADLIVHRDDADESENIRLLLEVLRQAQSEFDVVWLPELRAPGDISDTFTASAEVSGFRLIQLDPGRETVQLINLPRTYDDYLASLPGDHRRKRKARLRKLQKSCSGNLELTVVTAAEEVREYLLTIDEIRNASWKAEAFAPDRWKDEQRIGFHEAIARRGWFRGYLLKCGGQPIAYQIGYHCRGVFIAEEISYVATMRAHAPGAGLMLLMLADLIEHDPGCTVLLQPYDSELKRSFGNDTYDIVQAVLIPTGARRRRLLFGFRAFLAVLQQRLAGLARRFRTQG